ncbi:Respiratory nitrate reductase 2 gamma chain [Pseudovibrio sp. W64]|uniref:respiratory nitrate reductase subunit gamma n=1 Tax=unclassified Pseudovibrio TaxID=2627060 RepID=UPI0007AE8522|nr:MULTISPECIES: respiratory nitrate reductase subunit gamma [unclassified Pseudovibrio]KZK77829.1 Respiratory nitrate reductase 2 gamma chain [Pseudovibrio sp. W64]KZK87479.1 Respiratory nitrate reductase 2 gamma chain [Pseudovibrio sp. Ad13]KZK95706.1 Respiratory nitrate reductase 2 gamma chain [Pseudovibrio sp. Ad46]
MSGFFNTLFFGIYPYIALSVLIVGTIIRYDREPYSWRAGSSQLLRRKQLVWGSVLFHVGVLIIFFGHLVGLLTPIVLFDLVGISHGAKQVLAVVVGGIAGLMAIVGAGMLIHRRLYDARVRAVSSTMDTFIICLLGFQLLLGLGTIPVSLMHLDGEEMVKFMSWAQGIFTFRGDAASYVVDASWIFKLHLFVGLTILLIFPFTRLVHMLSVPARYLWRPGYQIVRERNSTNPRHPAE